HPLAAAIIAGVQARGIGLAQVTTFESITGKGVRGEIEEKQVALGNRALLSQLGIDPGELGARAEALRADGQTVMFIVIGDEAAGIVGVADEIKSSTPEAISALRDEGIRVVM